MSEFTERLIAEIDEEIERREEEVAALRSARIFLTQREVTTSPRDIARLAHEAEGGPR